MASWLRTKGQRAVTHSLSLDVSSEHAPAFYAAIIEICDRVATRTESSLPYRSEDAMTQALVPLNDLRAKLAALCPNGPDKDYRSTEL